MKQITLTYKQCVALHHTFTEVLNQKLIMDTTVVRLCETIVSRIGCFVHNVKAVHKNLCEIADLRMTNNVTIFERVGFENSLSSNLYSAFKMLVEACLKVEAGNPQLQKLYDRYVNV